MGLKTIRLLAMSAMLLALMGLFAGHAFGQVATGAVTGTVTDTKGAAMAVVTVTVHNEGTGLDTPETTNDSGVYTAPLLQPGTYDITASQPGFATVQNKGIAVQVGSTVRIDINMPVASQQSLVTVTTEAPVLETEKTEQSQNVSENLVANLPVSSRRWEQFVLLTPGTQPDGSTGAVAFHGINSLYNNNSVDGANNNSSYNGSSRGGATLDNYAYSPDSIREFQVSSSNFNAEVGQSAGGAVNAVTKSGTNQLHGDLFEYLRNPIFNAGDPVGKAQAATNNLVAPIPVHQQNQYGGSAGGPLVKDKLFFFATYDGYRKVFPNIVTTQQLSPSIPNLACPTAITAAQCAAAKNYALTQVIGSFPQFLRQDIELVKLDYQFNQANHVNIVANIRDWKSPKGGNGNALIGTQETFLQDRFVIATWTAVIGSNKVNELRYQWGDDNQFSPPQSIGGAPQVAVTNLFTYGSNNGSTYTTEFRDQFTDNFSITKGTHSFKMGVDINIIPTHARSAIQSAGAYTYSQAVALPSSQGCPSSGGGALFCDWAVDLYGANVGDNKTGQHWTNYNQDINSAAFPVGSATIAPGFAPPAGRVAPLAFSYQFDIKDYAGYFQDTWKMRPNLTVNLGLRYDVESFPSPDHPNTLTPFVQSLTSKYPADYGGVGPRAGFAYNFSKNTVLRVGGGAFIARTATSLFKAFNASGDEAQVPCSPATCSAIAGKTFLFPDVLAAQQDVPISAPFTSSTLGGANGSQPLTPIALNPTTDICPCGNRGIVEGKRPRAYEGQVAIERQLPGNMSFLATYVLTRGVHLPSTADANIANTSQYQTKSYDVVNSSGVTQLVSTVPFFTTRIDPAVGAIVSEYTSVNSWYNGMVLTLRKPMSHGIEILANYTLSRATDDGQAGNNVQGESFLATDGILNPFNQKGEQGYSQTDARHRFTSSVVWQPTFGSLSSRVARGFMNGWNLSGTFTASSGTRYSGEVQSTANQCLVVASPCPTTPINDVALEGSMSGADVSTSFANLGGRIAWLPRDSFTLPNYTDVDLRLARTITFHERYAVELRAEAFNLFNTTIVQSVNENAYTFTAPATTGLCLNTATNPVSGHSNTCMTPVSSFQLATLTSGNLLTSRQLQFGVRFSF